MKKSYIGTLLILVLAGLSAGTARAEKMYTYREYITMYSVHKNGRVERDRAKDTVTILEFIDKPSCMNNMKNWGSLLPIGLNMSHGDKLTVTDRGENEYGVAGITYVREHTNTHNVRVVTTVWLACHKEE